MRVKRGFLATSPNAPRIPIPRACLDSRTIYINELDVLCLFKDTREVARAYIETILPLLALQIPKDSLIATFWKMPDNAWMEFDYGRKVLSICFLEKNT